MNRLLNLSRSIRSHRFLRNIYTSSKGVRLSESVVTMSNENKFTPPINRQMRTLDREFFKKDVSLLVALFPEPKYLGDFVKTFKDEILQVPGVKHIVSVNGSKGVLLREDINNLDDYKLKFSTSALKKIEDYHVKLIPYTLKLDYSFWKANDILHAILPENLLDDIPTGFSQAGHIAHLNLRDEFKQFGTIIGEVILDKNPKIETVVDKVDTIDTKFRTFKMNVLAGRSDFIVEQSESGCKFRFDFSSVYWNSRLSTEHERLVKQFKAGEVVADVFAGVGPFALPASRNDVLVLANDLNPESYKYLCGNIDLNNSTKFVRASNLDGREFIQNSPKMLLQWVKKVGSIEKHNTTKKRKTELNSKSRGGKVIEKTEISVPKFISHYVMNLPDSALSFLNEFIGLYSRDPEVESVVKSDPKFKLPIINVHCFEKYDSHQPEPTMEELHRIVHSKICGYLDCTIPFENFKFHLVRKVAPTKPMFCVTFELPSEVAFKKV